MGMVTVERSDGIATVRLDRPDKRNALSFAMLRELRALARELARDRRLRAVVLAGSGDSFCAGIDLAELRDRRNRLVAFWELLKPGNSLFQRAFLDWQQLPVPVIASLHGHCFGAGLQLALAADIRIATPDCQLSIMEARWGLVPDMGLTRTLRGLVRPDVAKDLTYSARVVSGSDAQALGLVTRTDAAPLTAARALAQEYASRSPDAVLAAKRVLDAMATTTPGRALALEKRWQLKLLLGRNVHVARARAREPDRPFGPRQYRG
jgi:enoyl-CoA hydratase/carnithine racemase